MARKELIYQTTERDGSHSLQNYSDRTLADWITLAEKRGEDVYKIMTRDGFIVYEQKYIAREDGTQFLDKIQYLRDDELTPKEAVTAMINGEHLLDFAHFADTADYYWNGEQFMYSNNSQDYLNPREIVISEFSELRHRTESDTITPEREAKRIFQTLGFALNLSNLPLVKRQYGLTGAMIQAINMCKAQYWDTTETHIYSCLANLESGLQEMFPQPKTQEEIEKDDAEAREEEAYYQAEIAAMKPYMINGEQLKVDGDGNWGVNSYGEPIAGAIYPVWETEEGELTARIYNEGWDWIYLDRSRWEDDEENFTWEDEERMKDATASIDPEKASVTWDDIINNLQKAVNACKDADGNDNPEKLTEFKERLVGHLDNLDKKEKKSKKAKKAGIKKQAKNVSYIFETYHIDDYMLWDDEVFAAVQEFYKRKNIYPNILLANSKTFAKIDVSVKEYGTASLVYEGDEEESPEFDGLSGFTANDFSLTFCLDETVADDYFCLIYDSNPSFDGEEKDGQVTLFPTGKTKRRKYNKYTLAA